MMVHTFFLPIFTAAKDEKYFSSKQTGKTFVNNKRTGPIIHRHVEQHFAQVLISQQFTEKSRFRKSVILLRFRKVATV